MLNKEKITEHIWFKGQKCKVEQMLSPTKFDDFLICSYTPEKSIHIDSKTFPVKIICIDCHNHTIKDKNRDARWAEGTTTLKNQDSKWPNGRSEHERNTQDSQRTAIPVEQD